MNLLNGASPQKPQTEVTVKMNRIRLETGEVIRITVIEDKGRGTFLTDHGTLTWDDAKFDESLGLFAYDICGILLGGRNYAVYEVIRDSDGNATAFEVII